MEIDKRIGVCMLSAAVLVGLIVGMLIMIASPATRSQLICPPRLAEATRVDITAYYQGMPPDLTDADREFAEACDLEWGVPTLIEPPEKGA